MLSSIHTYYSRRMPTQTSEAGVPSGIEPVTSKPTGEEAAQDFISPIQDLIDEVNTGAEGRGIAFIIEDVTPQFPELNGQTSRFVLSLTARENVQQIEKSSYTDIANMQIEILDKIKHKNPEAKADFLASANGATIDPNVLAYGDIARRLGGHTVLDHQVMIISPAFYIGMKVGVGMISRYFHVDKFQVARTLEEGMQIIFALHAGTYKTQKI